MSAFVLCCDCGEPIDPRRDFRQVTGWEQARTSGGLHSIKDRAETGKWIHKNCYDLRHLHGQSSLI